MKGRVTLVGAGAGGIELLTIKGRQAIESCDTAVYDRLVSEDILKLIPENAKKINAGKKSGIHTIPQEEINEILLNEAQKGKNVVRIKGGDSFLFGRGGEELELLYKNNVKFEVVPGITSALAAPAYAGIPVTHRDYASSVCIITGHKKKNEPLKINYKSCVEGGGTLVFLMGVENLKNIMDGLIENGMEKNMPCAVVENGTRPNQRKVLGTISDIYEKCLGENIKSPSVIVVGKVCLLSEKFDWFERLPLKGIKIAVTRPKERIGKLSSELRKLGAEVFEFPCIETKSILEDMDVNEIVKEIQQNKWIAFTSPFGVKCVFEKLYKNSLDGRIFKDNKIAAIGKATKDELEKYCIFADLMPNSYDGKSLGESLVNEKAENVLLMRAEKGTRKIIEILESSNIKYTDFPVYKTFYKADGGSLNEKIKKGEIDYVTFTSASTVKAFAQCVSAGYDSFTGICIGESTNSEALKNGIKTIVSERAEIDGMIEELKKHIGKWENV